MVYVKRLLEKLGKNSVKKELFKSSVILSCTILAVFGLILAAILYHSGISHVRNVIKFKNRVITRFIEAHFAKIRNTVELLSNVKEVKYAPALDFRDRRYVLKLYKIIQSIDHDIRYIYSGYENGLLLINDYTPPSNFNPTVRPWYLAAIKAAPDMSHGIPYREIKTREWLVSISKVLMDNNEIKGVISIDCSVDKIVAMLRKSEDGYKTLCSFVVGSDGKILIHPEKKYLGKDLSDVISLPLEFRHKTGWFNYYDGKEERMAYYTKAEKIEWTIVTTISKMELIGPIIIRILISILAVGCIAVLTGWFLSVSLGKKLINPLIELKKRVDDIVMEIPHREAKYVYPDNEIGIIAKNIEQTKNKF